MINIEDIKNISKDHIVITNTEYQVRLLRIAFDKDFNPERFNKTSFWERKEFNYQSLWVWYFDETGHLSGSSGYNEPFYTIKRLKRPVVFLCSLED